MRVMRPSEAPAVATIAHDCQLGEPALQTVLALRCAATPLCAHTVIWRARNHHVMHNRTLCVHRKAAARRIVCTVSIKSEALKEDRAYDNLWLEKGNARWGKVHSYSTADILPNRVRNSLFIDVAASGNEFTLSHFEGGATNVRILGNNNILGNTCRVYYPWDGINIALAVVLKIVTSAPLRTSVALGKRTPEPPAPAFNLNSCTFSGIWVASA